MNKRNYKIFVEDIFDAIQKIENYTKGMKYDDFVENDMVIDAVLRNLEIIGEASKNLPESVRNKFKDVAWSKMISLRNIMIHEYFNVDLSIIWEIISRNLVETKPQIAKILENF